MSDTTKPDADSLGRDFVAFAVNCQVLRFGNFQTKAKRQSPYFFNAGLFDDGAKLGALASFYARRLVHSGLAFDMLFGPAYKGIVLASAVAVELARLGHNVPYAYNRKEAKDHGEGGVLVGAPLRGRPAAGQVAVQQVVRGGLVGDQVGSRPARGGPPRQLGDDIGRVAQQPHRHHAPGGEVGLQALEGVRSVGLMEGFMPTAKMPASVSRRSATASTWPTLPAARASPPKRGW